MATNLDIIKRALRKLRVLGGGREPEADQAEDAMQSLQSLIVETVGTGGIGRLNDVIASVDYTAREFDRIRCDAAGLTITLPITITPQMWTAYDYGWCQDYGWRMWTKPRPPFDRCPVVVIDNSGNETTSLYCAYQGKWVAINSLGLKDPFPFPSYLEDGFAAMLAEAVADEYGRAPGPITMRQSNRARYMLSYKMDSQRRTTRVQHF